MVPVAEVAVGNREVGMAGELGFAPALAPV
jgi:hypothetical protein